MVTLKESPTHPLSERSTTAIPDSIFHAADFLLGAGVVIIQPSTSKIVLVTDKRKRWFLPKGRKDKGESLEQTALREAYEETGYRIQFLPLYTGSLASDPTLARDALPGKDTEPIAVTTHNWPAGHKHLGKSGSGEYFASWYVGQIGEDAVPEAGTGMPGEASFVAQLCTIEEAMERLKSREVQRHVVEIAWKAWQHTLDVDSGRVPLNRLGIPGSKGGGGEWIRFPRTPNRTVVTEDNPTMVVLAQQPEVYQLSDKSTPAIPDSFFHATEFILGAGIAVIQPSTGKIVVVDNGEGRWFLPKGRKDVGESLDKTALREGYEESGYQIAPLPLYSGSLAPDVPSQGDQPDDQTIPGNPTLGHTRKDTEPIAVTTYNWNHTACFSRGGNGEYITFWYVGQITEDAVPETGTGMEFEDRYRSHLFTFEEAMEKITVESERHVLRTAWMAWQTTLQIDRGEAFA